MLDQTEHDSQSQENGQEQLKKARDALTQAMMDEAAATQVLEVEQDGQDLEPSAEVVEQIRQQAQEAVMANLFTQELQQEEEEEEERARESAQTTIFSHLGSQDEEEIAAVRIGAAVRGQQTRKMLQQESEALEMQDMARDNLTKALLVQVEDLEQEKHEEAAATKIGANVRGQQIRKRLEEARMAEERGERAQNAMIQALLIEADEPAYYQPEKHEEAAATKIGANVRGQQTRKRLEEARMAEERRERAQKAMIQALLIEADEPLYYQPDLPTIPEGTCEDSTNVQDGRSNDACHFAGEDCVLSESEVACDEAMRRANDALRISFGEL